jgi:hypothetical protein
MHTQDSAGQDKTSHEIVLGQQKIHYIVLGLHNVMTQQLLIFRVNT